MFATCHNDFGGIDKSFRINNMAGAGQPARSEKANIDIIKTQIPITIIFCCTIIPLLTVSDEEDGTEPCGLHKEERLLSLSSYIQSSTKHNCGKCVANRRSNGENNPEINNMS